MRLTAKLSFVLAIALSGCGRAAFSIDTNPSPDIAVTVATTGVDFFLETGQEFSNEVAGEVQLSNITFLGSAVWPGISSLQLELRASLNGSTGVGEVAVGLSKPVGWDSAYPVLLITVPAGSTNNQLRSENLKDVISPILRTGKFWVQGRLRYGGVDVGRTLNLKAVHVHAEGHKDLGAFSPLLNLGF